jgi:TRAP transporter 4TM/12TM fusion protein
VSSIERPGIAAAHVPGQREPAGWLAAVVRWACILLPALTLCVAFTGWFDTMSRRSGHLAVTIPLILLLYPSGRTSLERIGGLDKLLAAAAFASFAWILVVRDRIMWRLVYVDAVEWPDLVMGIIAIVLVFEATRRTLGWTLVALGAVFMAYALAGPLMPGIFEHKGVPFTLLIEHLYLVPEGLFNMVTGVMATYLLVFLAFGTLLRLGGGERIFTDLTIIAAGRWTAGPAKAAVLGSTLMGMVSGSTIANVVTTGTITIPLMKRNGFKPYEAAAIETAAGTGGAITPPVMGAGVFIMAEISGIPLLRILAYSILPALLYFFSIWIYVDLKARKRGLGKLRAAGDPERFGPTLARAAHLLVPLVVLVYMLIRDYSPFYASAVAVVVLVGVATLRTETRMGPRAILHALELTTREALVLSATSATAALVVGVINLTGLMLNVTSALTTLASGSLLVGIGIVAIISSVLGMGLPITSSYVILSTLGAPALTELGLSLLAAHLIIFWFSQTATITPPVCMTAFVAAQIAGAPPMRTGWEALRVAKALYLVPLMFAYSNLLSGVWTAMVFDAAAGMLWLAMFPVVTQGYFFGHLSAAGRWAAGIAGAMFFTSTFSLGLAPTLSWLAGGLSVMGVLGLYQRSRPAANPIRASELAE